MCRVGARPPWFLVYRVWRAFKFKLHSNPLAAATTASAPSAPSAPAQTGDWWLQAQNILGAT
eukprot:5219925-Prymnesium_polylepis.1